MDDIESTAHFRRTGTDPSLGSRVVAGAIPLDVDQTRENRCEVIHASMWESSRDPGRGRSTRDLEVETDDVMRQARHRFDEALSEADETVTKVEVESGVAGVGPHSCHPEGANAIDAEPDERAAMS